MVMTVSGALDCFGGPSREGQYWGDVCRKGNARDRRGHLRGGVGDLLPGRSYERGRAVTDGMPDERGRAFSPDRAADLLVGGGAD